MCLWMIRVDLVSLPGCYLTMRIGGWRKYRSIGSVQDGTMGRREREK